jgi:hypothetical protein
MFGTGYFYLVLLVTILHIKQLKSLMRGNKEKTYDWRLSGVSGSFRITQMAKSIG